VTESTLANGKEIIGTIPASLYHHGTLVNQDVDSGMMVVESSVEPVMERTITHEVIGTLQSRMHKGVNHEGARDGHLIIETSVEPQVFVKAKRAQNDQDDETWKTDAPHPTLNQFDQGDSRTVTAVVEFENELPALLTMHEGVTGQGGRGPLIKYDQSLTLTTGNGQVLFNQEEIKLAVRRLTPLECERLQGFPDGWTEGQADSHRYKQMGNAVAVPVVEWVIQGIMEAGL
jgi:DNA (cytosine-5)-methyltransferase 1